LLEQMAHGLLGELLGGQPVGPFYADALIQSMGAHLLRHYSNLPQCGLRQLDPPANGLSELALRRVCDYINAHLAETLSLAEIALVANLSPYHFSRLFRRSTGESVHQYVIRQRVEAAMRALLDGRLRIAEIAALVGFHDHSHLTRHFSRIYGVPPSFFLASRKNIHLQRTNIQGSEGESS
jgi:AraC family transcriptional regulator